MDAEHRVYQYATEFIFTLDGRRILITRYLYGGKAMPDGKWAICAALSGMNPHYLGVDGVWRYKYQHGSYDNPEAAFDHVIGWGAKQAGYETEVQVSMLAERGIGLNPHGVKI